MARTLGFNFVRSANLGRAAKTLPTRSLEPRPLDRLYLEAARRLADAACLPLILSRARVKALAISAQPRERNAGFADRGRSRLDLRI